MTLATAHDPAAVPAEPAGPGPLPRRVVDTFFSPGELFSRFGPDAPWGATLLIATLLSAAAFLLIPTELVVEQARERMAAQPGAAGADPAAMAGFLRAVMIGGNLVAVPLMTILVAGVLVLVFRVFMDGEAGYRQYLAVASHVAIVGAVGTAVTVPLMVATGNLQHQLSLALLAPMLETDTFAFRFLNGMNVFVLWQVALYAVAAGVMNREVATGKAAAVLFAVYAAIVAAIAFIAGAVGG
jgi:hypothetical protein